MSDEGPGTRKARRAAGSVAAALAVLHMVPVASAAQTGYARPASEGCELGAVTTVFIDSHSIFDTSDPDLDERFEWAYRLANRLHIRTRDAVIRRELLLGPGDCFDPALAEDSERLLRSLPFLSSVDVYGVAQEDSTYHLVVDTQDEWSTKIDPSVRLEDGIRFRGIELEEENLLGSGQQVRLFYKEDRAVRDYGAEYATPQLAGTRWDLMGGLGATRAGHFGYATIAYPFVGEVGRWAARQRFERRDRYFDYNLGDPGETHVLLPVRHKAFDLAVLRRLGPPGNLTMVGGALVFHEVSYPGGRGGIVMGRRNEFDELPPADSALADAVWAGLRETRDIRALLLLGQRNIWWVQRRGLDALRGIQDVRLGAELRIGLGRSVPALQEQDDLFSTADLYTGLELGDVLVTTEVWAEARRDFDAPSRRSEWEDVVADGELLVYWRPGGSERHTLLLRGAGGGAWHMTTPFQLTLGGELGLRGYRPEELPTGRRLTFSLEDRIFFGWPFPDVLDVGGAAFVDVAQGWAGDAAFGLDTGWIGSVGVGLRVGFPAGSRTTYRLDVAAPTTDLGDVRLVFSIGEVRGLSTRFGDPQLLRSRHGGPLADIFATRR